MHRHNTVLKIVFYEILYTLDLIDSIPPRYLDAELKSYYENERAHAFWDVLLYADHVEVRANRIDRIDTRVVDHMEKTVILLEMSCPWSNNKETKSAEKFEKYAPLRLEQKRQFLGYEVKQFNIIIDVLGGYSEELERTMIALTGSRRKEVLLKMQKARLSSTLNIARHFKVMF